jgi:hypothetical protein
VKRDFKMPIGIGDGSGIGIFPKDCSAYQWLWLAGVVLLSDGALQGLLGV